MRACQCGGVDFDLFLTTLEAEFDARLREEAEGLVVELADAERASLRLVDRLLAARGRALDLVLRGGDRVSGRLVDATRHWVVVAEGRGDSLVPVPAIVAVRPLGAGAADAEGVRAGLGMSSALRGLAERRIGVVVDHDAGRHAGVVVEVFSDHFDMEIEAPGGALDSRDRAPRTRLALVTSGVRRIRALGAIGAGED